MADSRTGGLDAAGHVKRPGEDNKQRTGGLDAAGNPQRPESERNGNNSNNNQR